MRLKILSRHSRMLLTGIHSPSQDTIGCPITPFRRKGTFGMTYCQNYGFQSDFSIQLFRYEILSNFFNHKYAFVTKHTFVILFLGFINLVSSPTAIIITFIVVAAVITTIIAIAIIATAIVIPPSVITAI